MNSKFTHILARTVKQTSHMLGACLFVATTLCLPTHAQEPPQQSPMVSHLQPTINQAKTRIPQNLEFFSSPDYATHKHMPHPFHEMKISANFYTLASYTEKKCDIFLDELEVNGIYEQLKAHKAWTLESTQDIIFRHEAAHCQHRTHLMDRAALAERSINMLAPLMNWNKEEKERRTHLLLGKWKENPELFTQLSETYADVYAFGWAASTYNESEWKEMLLSWAEYRKSNFIGGTHDTEIGLQYLAMQKHGSLSSLKPANLSQISEQIAGAISAQIILEPHELAGIAKKGMKP